MKKAIGIMLVLLALCWPALGAERTITFTWNQAISADFAGWKLYQGSSPGVQPAQANLATTIPYDGVIKTEYASNQAFACPDDSQNTHYFVLTAVDQDGNESGPSNEVSHTFDCMAPGAPQNFKVKITITVE